MGSLLSAPVFPADRHTMTEQPTTRAISRQSTSESVLKRHRKATSTRAATAAVRAAVRAMCANEKTEGLLDMLFFSSSLVRPLYAFFFFSSSLGRPFSAGVVPGATGERSAS